jgi:hypothetical protein
MRYMLLIYVSEADYSHMTSGGRAAIMQGHSTFAQEAIQRGILMGGAPLQPTSTARTVRVRKGKTLVIDGPFAETKEQLAGTYILDCKNLDEAIELATKIPDALHGSIEIRPLLEMQPGSKQGLHPSRRCVRAQ